MVQANLRLAGVGAVAACLLVGGPSAAVAVADEGGGHSGHSGQSGNGGWNNTGSNNNGGNRSDNANVSSRPSSKFGSGRDVGTSAQRPSSDYSPGSPQFKTPKVTVGDGRTPDVQGHHSGWGWQGPAPAPAPPPPPQVITVPLNAPVLKPIREQHGVVEQLVAEPKGELGPLWGVAGLLLIPAAGAVLGYRQARAAQSAAELGRHP